MATTTSTTGGAAAASTTTTSTDERPNRLGPNPVVVDMGTHGRGAIRKLRKGRGKLLDEVSDVVGQLAADGTVTKNAQVVIVVVRERPEDIWTAWLDR